MRCPTLHHYNCLAISGDMTQWRVRVGEVGVREVEVGVRVGEVGVREVEVGVRVGEVEVGEVWVEMGEVGRCRTHL